MKSMTGFGRSEIIKNNHKVSIEIKTVNNRFLDINPRMPRTLLYLEESVRSEIKNKLTRGRVDLYINYDTVGESKKTLSVDTGLVKAYLEAAKQIKEVSGLEDEISVFSLMKMPDVIKYEDAPVDEDEIKEVLMEALGAALNELVEARDVEGKRMVKDLLMRIELLRGILAKIEEREPLVVEEYKAKLRDRLETLLKDTDLDENRFNTEVLYFADRASITEEIVRLKSHFDQCELILKSDTAQGRNLDFLIQEMNREFNTIGSKSSDVTITNGVLAAKGEVEKIREQIQNIE